MFLLVFLKFLVIEKYFSKKSNVTPSLIIVIGEPVDNKNLP